MRSYAAAAGLLLLTTGAIAEQWPSRPMEMIIPFSAGGGVDTTGRRIARAMSEQLGQNIVVSNRDGASGSIGFNALAQAAPDGYTLGGGPTTPIANAIHLVKGVRYTLESFDYVCQTFDNVFVVAVPANSPFKTAQELFAAAREKPGKLTFGHAGVSSNSHLSVESVGKSLNLQFQGVPFRGDSPMIPVLLGGELDFAAPSLIAVRGQNVRVLMVFANERVPLLPDVPTATEVGAKHVPTLNGIYGPKGMPEEARAKLERACEAALKDEEVRKSIINGGQVPSFRNGADFKANVATDFAVKGELIRSIGLEAK